MTDHISVALIFLTRAMHCTAISEICPPALRCVWGGRVHLVNTFKFIYWSTTSNLAWTLMMWIDICVCLECEGGKREYERSPRVSYIRLDVLLSCGSWMFPIWKPTDQLIYNLNDNGSKAFFPQLLRYDYYPSDTKSQFNSVQHVLGLYSCLACQAANWSLGLMFC